MVLIAVVAGVLVWVAIARASGRSEAWDSDVYFSTGLPVLCLLAAGLGVVEPERAWHWGAWPSVGQFLALLIMNGVGNLLPLGIVVFVVFSIPAILAARMGAWFATKVLLRP